MDDRADGTRPHGGSVLRRLTGTVAVAALVFSLTVTLAPPAGAVTTLIKQIRMHFATPPLPDAAGVTWMPGVDRLMISDSEVEEMTIYQGVNLWQITRIGPAPVNATVTDTGTTYPAFSPEPTGLGYIQASNTLLISSDSSGGRLFFDRPGSDGRFGTADDLITTINPSIWGVSDCEDVAWDATTGHLWIGGGDQGRIYDIDPVNGAFGDGNDVTTVHDMNQFGGNDSEGIDVDPYRNTIVVADRASRRLYEVSKTGALLQTIDIRDFPDVVSPADVAVAPSSNNPAGISYYVADRGVDNNQNPNENDGIVHEFTLGGVSDPPPAVAVTAPAEGSTVFGPSVLVQATATDAGGVTQVQFFDGATSLGTDTNGTNGWSVTWNTTGAAEGPHTITARATDTAGQTAEDSNQVSVDNVDDPPSVTITTPPEGTGVTGANVLVQATATDDHGVTQVEFLDGTTSLGVDTNGTNGWSVTWNTTGAAEGPHTITARATDTASQTGQDSNVVNVDNTGPTVAITAPASGSTVSGTSVSVQANAADPSGVAQVRFLAGAAVIGTDTNGADGWSVSWNTATLANGPYGLSAVATDTAGNATTSAVVPVTVNNPLVIDVSIAATGDDAEEGPTGAVNTSSSDLDLMNDGTNVQRAAGLRFLGVNVPQGAQITNAYVQFQADETQSVATSLVIQGQAADTAPAFTTQNSNITNRPRTTASAAWSVPAWSANQRGAAQRTPNLAAVLQQIVDRPGWTPGNALVLVITGSGQRVADATGTGMVPASLHVEYGPSDASPSVTLTDPAEGTTVSGANVGLQATASDDEGVTQVEFFDGTTSLGVDTDGSNGWSATWDTTSAAEGPHTVTATATDTVGQTASDSNQVSVDNVDGPPVVEVTSPAEGARVSGSSVTVQATATDDHGVTQVEFLDGTTSLGVDTNGTNGWSVTWNTTGAAEGPHTITARATDTASQTGQDSNVVNVDNTGPTVAITAPASGSTVSGTSVSVQANAADPSGVAQVRFLAGAAVIGTDTNGADGWSVSWNTATLANGPYGLSAVATDTAGNATTSAVVPVTVNNPLVIDVSIAATGDDAEEGPTGAVNTSSSDLDLMNDGTNVQRAAGLRFLGVNVPQGAQITNAYVQFQADETQSVATSLVIQGQAADTAPAFTTQNSNITNRPRTTASAAWSVPAWSANQRGAAQRTPNLAAVLQQIVDRPGWTPGNALVLVITGSGQRVADATGTGMVPASLHVEYGPSDASPSVTLTDPAEGTTVSGANVGLQATASDDEGVTQVEFFDGTTSLGVDTDGSNGWSATWDTTSAAEGPHTVTATATDTVGQTASDSNQVSVDNVAADGPPAVGITSPAPGSTVQGTVTVQADASDDLGVSTVEFFLDGSTSLGVDTDGSNGWSAMWDTTTASEGAHSLTAVATDTGAQSTTSAAVSVTVDNSPSPSIAQVQAKAGDQSGVTSFGLTFDQAPTQGNLLVAIAHYGANRTPAIPAGWSLALESNTGGETVVFYRVAGAAEPSTVTYSISGATTFMSLSVFEYAGLVADQSQVLDRTVFGSASNATTVSTGTTQTTTSANELLIASVGLNGTRNFQNAWTNGFVRQTSARRQTVAALIVSQTGQFGTAESWDTSVGVSVGALVTFKGA